MLMLGTMVGWLIGVGLFCGLVLGIRQKNVWIASACAMVIGLVFGLVVGMGIAE